SSGVFRTAGNSTRSPTACDTSYLSFSKPKGPAIPQQPESMDCSSTPVLRNTDSSSDIPINDLWWQCPCNRTFAESCGGAYPGAWCSRNSLRRNVWLRSFVARAFNGNKLRSSSLNTEAQLGSRTTTG